MGSMVLEILCNIQESLKHAWRCGIGFLRCLTVKVLRNEFDFWKVHGIMTFDLLQSK